MSSVATLALSSSVSEPPGMMGRDVAGSCAQCVEIWGQGWEADASGGLSAGHHHDFPSLPPHTTQTFNSEPQLPKLLLFPEYKAALPPVVFRA